MKQMKEVMSMVNNVACSCENCGRTTEYVQIDLITIQHHSAQLCLACAHVLSFPQQQARFFKLVRQKKIQHSNSEMQQAHRLISRMIGGGSVLAAVAVMAVGVTQGFDINALVPNPIDSAQSVEASLTFLHLKSLQ